MAKSKDIQTRKLKREVTFPLSAKEKDSMNELLLKNLEVRDSIKDNLKREQARFRNELKINHAEIMETRKRLRDNTITDIVMVTERKDFKKKIVQYLYENKVVETRDMNEVDLQIELSVDILKTKEHTPDEAIADVIKIEKNKKTKKSPLDNEAPF